MAAVTWAQLRDEFHLRGTEHDHDQSTHAGGGGGGVPEGMTLDDADRDMIEAGPDAIATAFDLYDGDREYATTDGGRLYRAPDGRYVTLDPLDDGTYVTVLADLYEAEDVLDLDQLETEIADTWREDVVRGPVYHGTTSDEDVASILTTGLERRNQTRGLNNRWVGSSVFTTTDPGLAAQYGTVIEVDLPAAIADGVVSPGDLSREPGYDRADAMMSVAHSFEDYDFDPYSQFVGSGEDPNTVIVGAEIPAKYLRRYEGDGQFHLQGRHDQQTHGNRHGGIPGSTIGKTHADIALKAWQDDLQPYTDADSDRPVFVDPTGEFFSVQAANGQMIEATYAPSVPSGRRADPALRQRAIDMLNGVTDGYDIAPITKGVPMVLVVDDDRIGAPAAIDPNGTYYGSNVVLLNDHDGPARQMWDIMEAPSAAQVAALDKWMMPTADEIGFTRYIGAHEYGHVRAALGDDSRAEIADVVPMTLGQSRDDRTRGVWGEMSGYARTNAIEAHAEAFAEWVASRGRTTNRFARAYADIFGWDREEERALAASAGGFDMADWDDIVFICDSPLDGPSYVMADGTTVVGAVEEFHLAGTQYDHDQSTHAGGVANLIAGKNRLILDPLADIHGRKGADVDDIEIRRLAKYNGPIEVADQMSPQERRMLEVSLGTWDDTRESVMTSLIIKDAKNDCLDAGLDPRRNPDLPVGTMLQLSHIQRNIRETQQTDFQTYQAEGRKLDSIVQEFHDAAEGTNAEGPDYEEALANLTYELESQFGVSPAAGFIGYLNRSWTESSQDHLSQAHQIAVAGLRDYAFAKDGTPESMDWLHSHPEYPRGLIESKNLYNEWQGAFDAAARATYRHTQKNLPPGLEYVTVYRGVKDEAVLNTDYGVIGAEINPLSSWSADPETALQFGGRGWVFEARVPRQSIYSTAAVSGLGSLPEWEVVLTADSVIAVRVVNRHPETDAPLGLDEMYKRIHGELARVEGDMLIVRVDEDDADWIKRVAAQRPEQFHLAGTQYDHDQSTHGRGGGRIIVADDPKWHGHYFTSTDPRQPSGAPIRGTGLDPAALPDRLYHVTTNAPAVRESAMLRAAGEGGLGGDRADQIVSLTVNPDVAENLAASMRIMHDVAVNAGPEPEWRTPERDAWGRQLVASLQQAALAEGWEWGGALGDHQYASYGFNEWQMQFFQARQSKTGQRNPIFIRASQEQWVAIHPERIGVIEVDAEAVRATGALVTDLDWQRGGGLDEVRVYGDVPLRKGRDTFSHEQFHLKGTQYDHDQSTHGGGRRIAPVSGRTIKLSIESDLTMDALPKDIQTKIRAQFKTIMKVTPNEAREHMIDMAKSALAKGLPGRDWYQEVHDSVAASADEHGIDPEVAFAMTAVLSPGTDWEQNRADAFGMFAVRDEWDVEIDADHVASTNEWAGTVDRSTKKPNSDQRAQPGDTIASLYARDPKLAAVYIAKRINGTVGYSYDKFFKATELLVHNDPAMIDPVLNGTKVRSFYNNLARPQAPDNDVTVDVHMMRAMANDTASTSPRQKHVRARSIKDRTSALTGTPGFNGAPLGAMPLMADLVRQATADFNAAHNLDLLPHEFQAIVWTEQIALYTPKAMAKILRGDGL